MAPARIPRPERLAAQVLAHRPLSAHPIAGQSGSADAAQCAAGCYFVALLLRLLASEKGREGKKREGNGKAVECAAQSRGVDGCVLFSLLDWASISACVCVCLCA